ncbi:hypothetical protein A3D66_01330 [Candidatus Kaiserbacteria bacterium RIFCSPHIGHO2_02_FULL_50_9]|uniref:Uncharacterized protein n=1 Tax=Candidatus Kaiserbacteria bacterium RIFCSPLOWO2_01_FULL_51_21 TaxID=1798508 RepID=A0A1F6ECR6_9BACT|nr:MAG: hypothetical protein A3D66_01330 [Candidatus Kaiserbacteria bacterium RIFCSPHIGHO2_02_FULL_50_9]OGG71441.1 MAG: hypothetical protein A3A35_03280 [Candidatus Kaiserbacteria bacterium RIFCSPLOWO2_01_FULL_51_21]
MYRKRGSCGGDREVTKYHVYLGEVERNDGKKRKCGDGAWDKDFFAGENPERYQNFENAEGMKKKQLLS